MARIPLQTFVGETISNVGIRYRTESDPTSVVIMFASGARLFVHPNSIFDADGNYVDCDSLQAINIPAVDISGIPMEGPYPKFSRGDRIAATINQRAMVVNEKSSRIEQGTIYTVHEMRGDSIRVKENVGSPRSRRWWNARGFVSA